MSYVDQCTIAFEVEEHDNALEHISGEVNHPKHGEVASVSAFRITRSRMRDRSQFHAILRDEEDEELATFSTILFDKLGNIRPRFIEHEYFKGSGCWGKELNKGIILYITDITVEEKTRGMGIGSWTFNQLLDFLKPKLVTKKFGQPKLVTKFNWVFCCPSPNSEDITARQRLDSMPQYDNFFRKNGFRRVGHTDYFCYSSKPSHSSRLLPASDDVHHNSTCLYYVNHPECLDHSEDDVLAVQRDLIAREQYLEDPTFISRQNRSGCTILHLAAEYGNIVAVRTLLDIIIGYPDKSILYNRDNSQGLSPLDICTQTMEMKRAREYMECTVTGDLVVLRPKLEENDSNYLMVEAMLKRAMGDVKVEGMSDEEYVKINKWGCTCGKCLDGWLSPRMGVRLGDISALTYDLLGDMAWMAGTESDPCFEGNFAYADFQMALEYIPPILGPADLETVFEGYRFIFLAISQLLSEKPPIIPTPSAVVSKVAAAERGDWTAHDGDGSLKAKAAQLFLKKGGLIESALNFIVHEVIEGARDGTLDEARLDDDQWIRLPTCANDSKFEVARVGLELEELFLRGPYRHDFTDSSDDEMDAYDSDEEGMDDEDEDTDDEDEDVDYGN